MWLPLMSYYTLNTVSDLHHLHNCALLVKESWWWWKYEWLCISSLQSNSQATSAEKRRKMKCCCASPGRNSPQMLVKLCQKEFVYHATTVLFLTTILLSPRIWSCFLYSRLPKPQAAQFNALGSNWLLRPLGKRIFRAKYATGLF